jgi:hypothetical protein
VNTTAEGFPQHRLKVPDVSQTPTTYFTTEYAEQFEERVGKRREPTCGRVHPTTRRGPDKNINYHSHEAL